MNENDVMRILSMVIENKLDAEEVDHICNSLARMYERVNHVANKQNSGHNSK